MIPGLSEYVEHFRARVLQDALNEATSSYWLRRADQFTAAMPRPGEFHGQRTDDRLDEKVVELAGIVQACRARASVALVQDLEPDTVQAIREAA